MRQRAFIWVVGLLLVVPIASGCGGSGQAVSKPEFVRQADAACAKQQRKLQANPGSGVKGKLARSLTALRAEVDQIESIGAPGEDGAKVEAILDNVREAISLAEEDQKNVFGPAGRKLAKAEKLADDYGLKNCLLAS